MSNYLSTGGLLDYFSGGSGTSGVEADKRPAGSVDFIKSWVGIKKEYVVKNGLYINPSTNQVIKYEGRTQPVMDQKSVLMLFKFWGNLYTKSLEKMKAAGRDPDVLYTRWQKFSSDRIDWVNESMRYTTTINGVTVVTPNTYSYRGRMVMPFVLTDKAMVVISNGVIGLDNATYSAFNNMTKEELLNWAVANTPGGFILRPGIAAGKAASFIADKLPDWGNDIKDAIGFWARMIKWLFWGGLAYGGYWLYNKAKNR